jgi:hypothetical protein
MSPHIFQPALICPFTLVEEEALAWSILLFGQTILLHPYPLPLPNSVSPLVDQGTVQVRSMAQTPENIREKDRLLREIKQYAMNTPGRGFLKYLEGAIGLEETETQEEITGWMKGEKSNRFLNDLPPINGSILLCLIHEWLMQDWDLQTSLTTIEEKEKLLVQGWKEDPEEESDWEVGAFGTLKEQGTEMRYPPALTAWRELKKDLVPEPVTLFTTQQWVWEDYYNLDPEENRNHSIPLPKLNSLSGVSLQNPGLIRAIRETVPGLLPLSMYLDHQQALEEFQKGLQGLNLPADGSYRLLLPPHPLTSDPPSINQKVLDPLILLLPA